MKNLLPLVFLISSFAYSQKPVITNIHPVKAECGDTIHIFGSFYADSANTSVFFGIVKGKVISISANEIKVRVPRGMSSPCEIIVTDIKQHFSVSSFTSMTPYFYQLNSFANRKLSAKNFVHETYYSGPKFPYFIGAADMDNDSLVDLLTANIMGADLGQTVSILYRKADNSGYHDPVYVEAGVSSSLEVADINSDGMLDILTVAGSGHYLLNLNMNIGNRQFQQISFSNGNSNPQNLRSADFNNDGRMDLVMADLNSAYTHVFYRNTDGTYSSPVSINLNHNSYAVAIGDFNNDRLLDFATPNQYGKNVSIIYRKSDNTGFNDPEFINSTDPKAITACDFNGDSLMDIAFASCCSLKRVIQNRSGGYSVDGVVMGSDFNSLTAADINLDSKIDFLTLKCLYQGYADNSFGNPILFLPFEEAIQTKHIFGDFNHDGFPDIATQNSNNGTVTVYYRIPDYTLEDTTVVPDEPFIDSSLVFQTYPNPSDEDFITVQNNSSEELTIQILDDEGSLLQTLKASPGNSQYNHSLSNGIYYLITIYHDTVEVQKLVIIN